MKRFALALCLLWSLTAFGQDPPPLTPEEACKATGDYWSDDLEECFVIAEMSGNEHLLLRGVRAWEAQKASRLHEQQEYNAAGKAEAVAMFDARIAELAAALVAAGDAELEATYQSEIDSLEAQKAAYRAFDVSEHGAIISALSSTIGKHREELDKLLTQ